MKNVKKLFEELQGQPLLVQICMVAIVLLTDAIQEAGGGDDPVFEKAGRAIAERPAPDNDDQLVGFIHEQIVFLTSVGERYKVNAAAIIDGAIPLYAQLLLVKYCAGLVALAELGGVELDTTALENWRAVVKDSNDAAGVYKGVEAAGQIETALLGAGWPESVIKAVRQSLLDGVAPVDVRKELDRVRPQ